MPTHMMFVWNNLWCGTNYISTKVMTHFYMAEGYKSKGHNVAHGQKSKINSLTRQYMHG